jgi:hypothetical protein
MPVSVKCFKTGSLGLTAKTILKICALQTWGKRLTETKGQKRARVA